MQRPTRQHGFTLIEIIISLVILSVLAAAAGYGLTGGVLAFSSTADSVHTLSKLRYATERMSREIREIRRDLVTPAVYDISTMTASALTFTKTDGTTVTLTGTPPLLTLAYSGIAGSPVLTDQLGSLDLDYYQADGTTLATGNADVAFIELELTLAHNANSYPQRNRVSLRNQQ